MDGEKLTGNNTVEEGDDARPRRERKELLGEGLIKQPQCLRTWIWSREARESRGGIHRTDGQQRAEQPESGKPLTQHSPPSRPKVVWILRAVVGMGVLGPQEGDCKGMKASSLVLWVDGNGGGAGVRSTVSSTCQGTCPSFVRALFWLCWSGSFLITEWQMVGQMWNLHGGPRCGIHMVGLEVESTWWAQMWNPHTPKSPMIPAWHVCPPLSLAH